MKVFELKVHLFEGGPVDLGLFASKEAAEAAWDAEKEDWEGPNVRGHDITAREVKG